MRLEAKDIVKDTDPSVRQKSEKVQLPLSDEDRELALALVEYVKRSQDPEISEKEGLRPAVGIAAVQVGVHKRILGIVIPYEEDEDEVFCLVNQRIVSHSVQDSYLKGGEGCLSVEEVHEGYVPRHARIKVRAYDVLQDQEIELRASGYAAIVLQHEMDHFEGVLFYDRINQENPWQEIEDAEVIE